MYTKIGETSKGFWVWIEMEENSYHLSQTIKEESDINQRDIGLIRTKIISILLCRIEEFKNHWSRILETWKKSVWIEGLGLWREGKLMPVQGSMWTLTLLSLLQMTVSNEKDGCIERKRIFTTTIKICRNFVNNDTRIIATLGISRFERKNRDKRRRDNVEKSKLVDLVSKNERIGFSELETRSE